MSDIILERITGQKLNRMIRPNISLFPGIVRHKVPWIREADFGDGYDGPNNATVIEEARV